MTEAERSREEPREYKIRDLLCRRTGQRIPPQEHERCPYCFGRAGEVEQGVHERFCDYRPEQDPICFGMPEWSRRMQSG